MGQCSSMGGHGRPQVLHCDNVLCYFTTNIVHRNCISWYVAATVAMKEVPLELSLTGTTRLFSSQASSVVPVSRTIAACTP